MYLKLRIDTGSNTYLIVVVLCRYRSVTMLSSDRHPVNAQSVSIMNSWIDSRISVWIEIIYLAITWNNYHNFLRSNICNNIPHLFLWLRILHTSIFLSTLRLNTWSSIQYFKQCMKYIFPSNSAHFLLWWIGIC